MSDSKATPGPWHVFYARTGRSTYPNTMYVRALDVEENAICKLLRRSSTEQRANANLIAAAPALREACEAVDHFAEGPYLEALPTQLREQLKAALALAKGE
ncbi:MAG: hypothetical protein ACRD2R_01385 [Terriglobales bacterium]